VWKHASGILFLADRLKFCRADGSEQPHNSGAPAVLVAFGERDLFRLRMSGIAGFLVTGWERVQPFTATNAQRELPLSL
jgi:hypothetical protein